MNGDNSNGSFWDHLDILRAVILKTIAVCGVFSIIAFIFKNELFDIVLAPKSDSFITYRILDEICRKFGVESPENFDIQLINTGLAQQFIIHMKTALCAGVVFAAPYALYQIFTFVSPGLYRNEREYTSRVIISGYVMFLIGTALSYFIIFPLTFQFLGTYQVDDVVVNMISLDSYMSTLIVMCLCMGIICELPVISWLCAKMGFLTASFMSQYRKHAIVIILIVAAIITPTSDIFTLMLVTVPIWLLYEISIQIVRRIERMGISTSTITSKN